jgi:glucose-1-phosphate cytidylyltransferase
MKVVVLCGGQGTRLREETEFRPKPMVEIGGKPILWHIMRHYSRYEFNDFVLCLGYKGEVIRSWIVDYPAMNADVTVTVSTGIAKQLQPLGEEAKWNVGLIDTGADTPTGGRVTRVRRYVDGETFMCTYGDGLSNVNLGKLLEFHRGHGKIATVTGVRPFTRFGQLHVTNGVATGFREKPRLDQGWVNGGFFVFEPKIFDYLDEKATLEREPLERLAADGELAVYQHQGYWAAMDTYRETQQLNEEWRSGRPGWLED